MKPTAPAVSYIKTTPAYDLQLAIKIVKVLMSSFESSDAYKFGIIDKNGNPLKSRFELKTTKEQEAYSPVMKLLFRIKQLFDKYNVTRAQAQPFVTLAGALKYIRENDSLVGFSSFMDSYEMTENDKRLMEEIGSTVAIGGPGITPDTLGNVEALGPKTIKNTYTKRNSIVRRPRIKKT